MRTALFASLLLIVGCYPTEPTPTPPKPSPSERGRLIYELNDCEHEHDLVPLLENLKARDTCDCGVEAGAVGGAAKCVSTGDTYLSTTSRSWWCRSGDLCSRHDGNVSCAEGETKSLWSQGFTDTRSCGCSGECGVIVVGEFDVGVVVTTCCK